MLSVRCLSVCLSATLVYCGQTVGRIKMKLGSQVGLRPGHIVLGGDQAPPTQKEGRAPPTQKRGKAPKFSAHVYCGQTAGCMKLVLGTEVGLSPGDCVRWGPSPLPPKVGGAPLPNFRPISIVAKRLHASKCHLV